jgi:hypothetical protein
MALRLVLPFVNQDIFFVVGFQWAFDSGAKLPHFHNKKGRPFTENVHASPFLSISLLVVSNCPQIKLQVFLFIQQMVCTVSAGFLFRMLAARGKLTGKHWADSISCQFSTFGPASVCST